MNLEDIETLRVTFEARNREFVRTRRRAGALAILMAQLLELANIAAKDSLSPTERGVILDMTLATVFEIGCALEHPDLPFDNLLAYCLEALKIRQDIHHATQDATIEAVQQELDRVMRRAKQGPDDPT